MPSNKSVKQAIQMKMKQHPSKKKLPTKTTSADSVSETISFVIKGKLTPIKPTFVARKVGVRKKILKLDKKLESAVPRKKQVTVKNSDIILCAPQAENEVHVTPKKVNSPKKVKKKNSVKNIRDSKIEVVIRKPTNKIVKQKLLRNTKKIKLNDEQNKIKILPTKTKTIYNHQVKETSKTEFKAKNVEAKLNNEDMKKKKTIAKLLKQANKELEKPPKPVKDRLRAKVMENLKPKIQKTKIIKSKQMVNKNVNPVHKLTNYSDDEIKKEKQNVLEKIADPSSDLLNSCNREDSSTSDDNNLEQIRQSLKRECPKIKNKTKTEGNSLKHTNKISPKVKPVIGKKATPTQMKKTHSKIKKARIEDPKTRKLKLYGFWNRPKRQRVASLNAIAKVHCLYENEGRISMLDNPQVIPIKKEVIEKTVKCEDEKTKKDKSPPPQRSLRYVPGLRGVGKHWDMHNASSSSSDEYSDDAEVIVKKIVKVKKEPQKKVEEEKTQKKRKRKQTEIVMDLKDMVVSKRMASLNATAILAASYSQERRHPKSPKGEITDYTDSSDDDSITDDERNKSYEADVKKEDKLIEVRTKPNKKVAVIVNQDTDVTITGVYVNSTTRSTHHEGYCSIAGMQYRISATSHTQTAATAVATETLLQSSTTSTAQENSNSETPTGKSYKPLDALSNMRPPSGGPHHGHQTMGPPQHVMSLSPSGIRHGCSSAFTAPHPSPYHHVAPPQHGPPPPNMNAEPGYIHGE
ncbi:hypothetical protein WA026_006154 [Henosepilachna vigintioctopunctata]|uniref:Uncharacterized protein n=1 Tax=Henosepilachna vigintioctopunctata TaxID=420089 RepID=A0AAW1TN13_9CUCU